MSEEKNKFKVGDIVVNLNDVSLWDNSYHFEKFINSLSKKETVVQTANGRFTTDVNVDLSKYEDREDWKKQHSIYFQNDGSSAAGFKKMYNWTTNKANIVAYFEGIFKEALTKCQNEDDALIARLEAEIREKQAKIEKIKSGNRVLSHNNKVNEREFINSQINKINKIFETF